MLGLHLLSPCPSCDRRGPGLPWRAAPLAPGSCSHGVVLLKDGLLLGSAPPAPLPGLCLAPGLLPEESLIHHPQPEAGLLDKFGCIFATSLPLLPWPGHQHLPGQEPVLRSVRLLAVLLKGVYQGAHPLSPCCLGHMVHCGHTCLKSLLHGRQLRGLVTCLLDWVRLGLPCCC